MDYYEFKSEEDKIVEKTVDLCYSLQSGDYIDRNIRRVFHDPRWVERDVMYTEVVIVTFVDFVGHTSPLLNVLFEYMRPIFGAFPAHYFHHDVGSLLSREYDRYCGRGRRARSRRELRKSR